MDIEEALRATAPENANGSRLGVDIVLDKLGDDADTVRAKLLEQDSRGKFAVNSAHMARALTALGHEISKDAVRKWRDRYAA